MLVNLFEVFVKVYSFLFLNMIAFVGLFIYLY